MGNLTKNDLNTVSFEELQSNFSSLENSIKSPNDKLYLVLGFGSGFVGMTIIELLDANQKEEIRKKYKLGKKYKGVVDLSTPFPKTQRIAYKNGLPSMPFGWIELSPSK